jgi:hypothetical protein
VGGLVETRDELDERGFDAAGGSTDHDEPGGCAELWPGGNPRGRLRVSRAAKKTAPAMSLSAIHLADPNRSAPFSKGPGPRNTRSPGRCFRNVPLTPLATSGAPALPASSVSTPSLAPPQTQPANL